MKSDERRSASWDIKNAPKNYLSLVISQGGSALFAFISVWLITRFLGSESFGGIVAIIATSQIAQVFVNWTCVAVVRFGVDEFVETGKIARAFWLRLLIMIPNLLAILLIAKLWFPEIAAWLKLDPATSWLVIAHFAFSALWIHGQFSLQGAKMPREQGHLLMLERLFILLGLLGLIAAGRLDGYYAMLCYSVAPLLCFLTSLALLRGYIFAKFEVGWSFAKEVMAYSLPLLPYSLIGYFSTGYINSIFVNKMLSANDLGIYSVAAQISGIALQLPTIANSLLIPLFVTLQKENQTEKTRRYFRHALPTLILSWALFCGMMAFVCSYAIPVVFGEKFSGAILPLWVLMVGSTFSVPMFIGYSALCHATSKTLIATYTTIISGAANLILSLILIPRFGIAGSAWAAAATFLLSSIAFATLLNRQTNMPISWTFFAPLPILAGAIAHSIFGIAALSLLVCVFGCILLVCLNAGSIAETKRFMLNFTKR